MLGLYASKSKAMKVWDLIEGSEGPGPVTDELSDTPFGSAQLLPPQYECKNCYHQSHDRVSDHLSEDSPRKLEKYVADSWEEYLKPVPRKEPSPEDVEKYPWLYPSIPSDSEKTFWSTEPKFSVKKVAAEVLKGSS